MKNTDIIVWIDRVDYTPGSVVTISGSDNAEYQNGETVNVTENGPNQYLSYCYGSADQTGSRR